MKWAQAPEYRNEVIEAIKIPPKSVFSGEYRDRKNLRVVMYCRVSTDKLEQQTSIETQKKHYDQLFIEHKDWIPAGLYVDEGLSGTSMRRRTGFKKMLADARVGRFDMIVTKSVSRYARNLLHGIETARELIKLPTPVGILFEEESLNTFRPDSEFILSVMLLIAQGESEKRSAAIKKAYQWRCDAQNFLTPTNALLGYTKDEDGNMVIEPEEAKTVKAIYAMYLNGFSTSRIARALTASGKPTGLDNTTWCAGSVLGILRNERHCGDLVAQKTVTTDVLEHKAQKNRGQLPLRYKDGHHEGIVTRDEYIRALLLMDANTNSVYYNPYYRIKAVQSGLLTGFIPINLAFGGYRASHYLGVPNLPAPESIKPASQTESNFRTLQASIRVIRSQDISGNRATMLISSKTITFNKECKARLHGISHAEILLHPHERLIALRESPPDNKNAILWPTHSASAAAFLPVLFELMGWNPLWKYRVTADHFYRDNEQLLVFDLNDPEFIFFEEAVKEEGVAGTQAGSNTMTPRVRRSLQAERWRSQIGAEPAAWMAAGRRSAAFALDRLETRAPALPLTGYPGNPGRLDEPELTNYLESLEVRLYA